MIKKVLLIVIPIVVFAILVIGLILFIQSKDLTPFFDDWETESDFANKKILYDNLVEYNSDFISLKEALGLTGTIQEVFCFENGRFYFFYIKGGDEVNWCIASCKENGSDLQIHYAAPENTLYTYYPLARFGSEKSCKLTHPGLEAPYGGLYRDHTIYLRHSAGIIAYSITENTVFVVDSIPESSYSFEIDDFSVIKVIDKKGTLFKTLTLEDLAVKNDCAKKLLGFYEKSIWDKEITMLDKLFVDVKEINDHFFILCKVLDYFGNAYAVVFEYAPLFDNVEYVTYYKIGGYISEFDFIPIVD